METFQQELIQESQNSIDEAQDPSPQKQDEQSNERAQDSPSKKKSKKRNKNKKKKSAQQLANSEMQTSNQDQQEQEQILTEETIKIVKGQEETKENKIGTSDENPTIKINDENIESAQNIQALKTHDESQVTLQDENKTEEKVKKVEFHTDTKLEPPKSVQQSRISIDSVMKYTVYEDYPTETIQDKLQVPYIEKSNGNILASQQKYQEAIQHYNKALFGLKMLFEHQDNLISDQETAIQFIKEIELPCCLNLGLCYLKTEQFHYVIQYCSQALEKDEENDKAFFRRGLAYLGIGEFNKSKSDLLQAYHLTEGKDSNVKKALERLQEKQKQERSKEIEFSKKFLNNPTVSPQNSRNMVSPQNSLPELGQQGKNQDSTKKLVFEDAQANEAIPQNDSFFQLVMRLIKSIILLPFYLYMRIMEKILRFFFQILYLTIKISEKIPITGPLVTRSVNWLSQTRFICWIQTKLKTE